MTKIWAAGVQASPLGRTLAEQTGAPLDRAGRIGVNPDLTLPGHPEVFVVGDMIALDNLPGRRPGRDPGRQVRREVDRAPASTASRRSRRSSTSTRARWRPSAGSSAVALIGKFRLTGVPRLAALAGAAPDLHHRLQEPADRAAALVVSFLGRGRSERTTTEQQIYARAALQRLQGGAADLVSAPGAYDRRAGDPRGHPAGRARGAGHRGGAAHRLRRARAAPGLRQGLRPRPISRRGGRPRARG